MPVRLLFLDRDGTLNRSLGHRPPNVPEEVELLPGIEPQLVRYVHDGWRVMIVTNQGGVARGYMDEAQAYAVLQRVIDLLPVPVAAAYLCPHMAGASAAVYNLDCPNRKPRPGFLLQALRTYNARPEDCLFVGDALTDQRAARAAGVPFCWADRFFGRPIDRGMQRPDGTWFQVRETEGQGELALLALERGTSIGRLELTPSGPSAGDAELHLWLETTHRQAGVGPALVRTAVGWAQEKALARLFVDVAPGDAAARGILRQIGFVETPGDSAAARLVYTLHRCSKLP